LHEYVRLNPPLGLPEKTLTKTEGRTSSGTGARILSATSILFIINLCAAAAFSEPNLEGVTGLINIPDAQVSPDGWVYFGFGANEYNRGSDTFIGEEQWNHFVNIGFLPHLELTGRMARFPDYTEPIIPGYGDAKDRTVSAKIQPVADYNGFSFAAGVTDLGGESQYQKSFYGAVDKTFFDTLKVTLGAGSDNFDGVFGGVDWEPAPRLHLLGEYDTEDWNAGLRYSPWDWLSLSVSSLGGEEFGAGITARFDLTEYERRKPTEPKRPIARLESGSSQADPRILAEALADEGFENVRAFLQDGELVVYYENRRFLLEERALAAVGILSAMHAPREAERVRVVAQIDGMPHLDFVAPPDAILAFARGEIDEASFRAQVTVNRHREAPIPAGVRTENRSGGKADIFLRPGLDIDFGRALGPFRQRVSAFIDPEFEIGYGFSARGRFSYVINNNLSEVDDFNTERVWLGWGGRPGGVSVLAKAGIFGIDLTGAQLEAEADIDSFDAVLGGNIAWTRDETTDAEFMQALGKFEKRFPDYDLTARIVAGQFQFEDKGARVEATRYFGPVEVTFFAYDAGNPNIEGGVTFYVPLPLYDDGPPADLRFGVAPDWGFQYRSELEGHGQVLTAGQELFRYRRRLHPDYVLEHLFEWRRAAGWLN